MSASASVPRRALPASSWNRASGTGWRRRCARRWRRTSAGPAEGRLPRTLRSGAVGSGVAAAAAEDASGSMASRMVELLCCHPRLRRSRVGRRAAGPTSGNRLMDTIRADYCAGGDCQGALPDEVGSGSSRGHFSLWTPMRPRSESSSATLRQVDAVGGRHRGGDREERVSLVERRIQGTRAVRAQDDDPRALRLRQQEARRAVASAAA